MEDGPCESHRKCFSAVPQEPRCLSYMYSWYRVYLAQQSFFVRLRSQANATARAILHEDPAIDLPFALRYGLLKTIPNHCLCLCWFLRHTDLQLPSS
jgi:hypothetical protein